MGKFYYRARDRKGGVIHGSIQSDSIYLARKALGKQNIIPLEIGRFNLRLILQDLNASIEKFTQKVSLEEKMVLMSQIETGISVGIPIIQMLSLLQQDLQNKFLKETLHQITLDITEGSTIHDAFAKHPEVFDPTTLGLIKTGEVTGKLDETLARITQLIEQQSENQAKVKSATFYPKIVVFVLLIVILVVVYFVIPKLKAVLTTLGTDLPPITQFVVGTSDFFIHYWYLILAAALGARYSFKRSYSTPEGKRKIDRFILKLPSFGIIFTYLELNNFCVILELLINSGVPLLDALETLKSSQKNQMFIEALNHCQEVISKGGSLTQGLEGQMAFPSTFRNLLGVGEESGRLPPVLKKMARYYQLQLDYKLDNLAKAIEPILLFFIFCVVLIIALAIFLPIWKLNSAVRH